MARIYRLAKIARGREMHHRRGYDFAHEAPPLDTSSLLRPKRQWIWQGALFVLGLLLGALLAVSAFAYLPWG